MVDLRQNADARSILERDGEHLLPVDVRYPVVMERGEGVYLFDTSGNRFLDLMAALGAMWGMKGVFYSTGGSEAVEGAMAGVGAS